MDVGEVVRIALLLNGEATEILDFAGLFRGTESAVVAINVTVAPSTVCGVELGLRWRSLDRAHQRINPSL